MSLREVVCERGHSTEVLLRGSSSAPQCACGATTSLNPISRIAIGYRGKWGGDYTMPHDVRDALDQSVGWKQEYVEAQEEASQDGFR